MKKVIFIIGVLLQFSSACFSQESQNVTHNVRIIQIVNPVNILRVNYSVPRPVKSNESDVISDNTTPDNNLQYKITADSVNSKYSRKQPPLTGLLSKAKQ